MNASVHRLYLCTGALGLVEKVKMLNSRLVDLKTSMLWFTLHVLQARIGSRRETGGAAVARVRTSAAPTDPPPHTNSICLCVLSSPLWCSSYTSGLRNLQESTSGQTSHAAELHLVVKTKSFRSFNTWPSVMSQGHLWICQRWISSFPELISKHPGNRSWFFVFFHSRSQVVWADLSTDF